MDNSHRQIDILLFDGLNILDVAGPVQAFAAASYAGPVEYRLRYVTLDGAGVLASCGLRLEAGAVISPLNGQDLLVPGGEGIDAVMADPRYRRIIGDWREQGGDRRIISVCSGALALAQAGILDGLRATTHWVRAEQARRQFPRVLWSPDRLYHIEGNIMTSAGVSTGIDLALEIIRRDAGGDVALAVARELVVYLKRTGGQNQFADLLEAQFAGDSDLRKLVTALQQRPGHCWTLENMAEAAGLTPRTLSRRFTQAYGQSPVKFLERYRVKLASDVLSGGAPVGRAIEVSGFSDFQQMQRAFKRHLGRTVGTYRDNFCMAG